VSVPDPDPADGAPVGTVGEESRLIVEAIVAGLEAGARDDDRATDRDHAEDGSESAGRSSLRALLARVDPTVLHSAADAAELLARGLRDVADGLARPDHTRSRHRSDPRPGPRTPRKDPPPCP